jgi:hypothetical protein
MSCEFVYNEWYNSQTIKPARVKPVFKKNNRSYVGNYKLVITKIWNIF